MGKGRAGWMRAGKGEKGKVEQGGEGIPGKTRKHTRRKGDGQCGGERIFLTEGPEHRACALGVVEWREGEEARWLGIREAEHNTWLILEAAGEEGRPENRCHPCFTKVMGSVM